MLPASWALVHYPLTTAGRMHRRLDRLTKALVCPRSGARPPILPGHQRRALSTVIGSDALVYSSSYTPGQSEQVPTASRTLNSVNSTSQPDQMVFEEPSEDYADVIAGSVPLPPTTLQVIEQRLPKLLPEPVTGDSSIFEDELDPVYDLIASTPTTPTTLVDSLVQLVQKEDYDHAYEVLQEIKDLHVPIPPSSVYASAALHVLRTYLSHQTDPQDRDEAPRRFIDWLTLFPLERQGRKENYPEIKGLLLNTPTTDIALIRLFAVLMASKGYAEKIISPFVPLIVRYSSPDLTRQFLQDFEEANKTYWVMHRKRSATYAQKRVATILRSFVARTMASSGRLEEAVDLLPSSLSDPNQLTPLTYQLLRLRLVRAGEAQYAHQISFIDTLLSQDIGRDGTEMLQDLRGMDEVVINQSLAQTLRYLKDRCRHRDILPHPYTLVYFIEDYVGTGRTSALQILRSRALRSDHSLSSVFIFAEMLYYKRRGLHQLVIQTFVEEFYTSGVLKEELLWEYEFARKHLKRMGARRIVSPINDKDIHLRGKLWPKPQHCALIWHSLLERRSQPSAKAHLYMKLLRFAQESQRHRQRDSSDFASSFDLPIPPSWSVAVSPATFTPFLRMVMHNGPKLKWRTRSQTKGGDGGIRVINDMIKCGIRPTVYHYTELGSFLAFQGDVERALAILEGMEKGLKMPTEDGHPRTSLEATMPEPDLVTYISLLRGFIKSRRLDGAEVVRSKMLERYECEPGVDEYLDQVLQDYEALKAGMESVP